MTSSYTCNKDRDSAEPAKQNQDKMHQTGVFWQQKHVLLHNFTLR
jgi:hypothetical protein